jgi:hypothetical protein
MAARVDAALEVEYVESFLVDLEADLAQLDSTGACCVGRKPDAAAPAELSDLIDLIAALRAVPEFKVAAGEVLYQSITNRASIAHLRSAALKLHGVLMQQLAAGE